jgi:4-alpha-glucanotransferase
MWRGRKPDESRRGFLSAMNNNRKAGILLHPTSLPGPFGIGDLGPQACRWVDFLAAAGQSLWQILPLTPTGYGDSPYQCYSDSAGNALLVSPERMLADGLLNADDLAGLPRCPEGVADYPAAAAAKNGLFRAAFERLQNGAVPLLREDFRRFEEEEKTWLDDFCLYSALKRAHERRPWWEWEPEVAQYQPAAVSQARAALAAAVSEAAFEQFLFRRQWDSLREYARGKGVALIGDLPVFCALDSAEVWSNRSCYQLDDRGRPTVVAGVPPDYFSPTGQLWGNPIFRWDELARDGFAWWIRRARAALRCADLVRLDHFRGYVGYWAVPAGEKTAERGSWTAGPGAELFDRVRDALGGLPFLAEDLGVITAEVAALRKSLGLPGMRVLQFAFEGEGDNPFLPHNYEPRTAVYTGTHDNDTSAGWYRSLAEPERRRVDRYLACPGKEFHWEFIRLAWASVAEIAICPLQDLLGLGSEGRMNYPGRPGGNWTWRFRGEDLRPDLAERMLDLTGTYGRVTVA